MSPIQDHNQLVETNDDARLPIWVNPIIKDRCSLCLAYNLGSLNVKLAKERMMRH